MDNLTPEEIKTLKRIAQANQPISLRRKIFAILWMMLIFGMFAFAVFMYINSLPVHPQVFNYGG